MEFRKGGSRHAWQEEWGKVLCGASNAGCVQGAARNVIRLRYRELARKAWALLLDGPNGARHGGWAGRAGMSWGAGSVPLTPAAPELSVGGGGKRPWLDGLPACEEPPVRKKKPHPHLPGWKQSISSTKSTSPDYFLPSAKLVCHSRGGLGWDIHKS